MTQRNRGWTITLNNYNEEEWNSISELAQMHSEKFILGKEVGESGTPHVQGYIYFKNPRDMKSVKKVLKNERLHLEIAKGSTKQNLAYCSKDGDYISKGMEEEDKTLVKVYTINIWAHDPEYERLMQKLEGIEDGYETE